jgi:acetyl-CoA C-acetyltransferase
LKFRAAKVERDGYLTTITLNRPEVRNALDQDACFELAAIFDAFEADDEQRVAIVTGTGEKAFCAGADLKNPVRQIPPSGFAGLCTRFDRTKPVIAAINGLAGGGGFETALACDIVIAADHAEFGLLEARVGLAALAGGVQRLAAIAGSKRAMGMLLTARKIGARQAYEFGVVNEVVPAAELMTAAKRWANEILACSPMSHKAQRAMLRAAEGRTLESALAQMPALPEVQAMLASEDLKEGARAFAEKRRPVWKNR